MQPLAFDKALVQGVRQFVDHAHLGAGSVAVAVVEEGVPYREIEELVHVAGG